MQSCDAGSERFAPIPHECAQEPEVGRRQRPAEQRQVGRAGVAVGIIDRVEHEFGIGRNADADANQCLRKHHAVCRAPGFERRYIGVGRVRAVVGVEDGIGASRDVEACLDVAGSYRPPRRRLVAAHAGPPIGPQALEERPGEVDLARGAEGGGSAAWIGKPQHVGEERLLARAAGRTHEE